MNPNQPDQTSFRFCPRCGTAGGTFLNHHEYRCPACGHRYFHNVAAAAGVLAQDDEGRFLFLVRGMEPGKGLLGLPGGFVDPGESITEAVRREVREELGAEIDTPQFLNGYPNQYAFAEIWYNTLDLYFSAKILTPFKDWSLDPREVSSVVWKFPAEVSVEELSFPSLRALWADWVGGCFLTGVAK